MSFDPIVQKSISEQVAQRLLTMIRSGLLKPDQQLPPERELAAMLGVGRPAVLKRYTHILNSNSK